MNLTSENTAIVLDSTSDFPEAKARERFDNIRVVPLHVLFGSEDILDHVGISGHEFYERLRSAPALPTTAQPKPGEFLRAYEDLARYDRIYSLHLSRELSGTYGSAVQAAGIFGADRVRLIDSETASLAVAMLALAIERRLARGTSDAEIEQLIDRFKRDNGVVFTVGTLEYLQRGGRIGKAQALAGTLLSVKPILSVESGVVVPVGRVRGRQKALAEFRRLFEEATENRPGLRVAIAHADAPEWVEDVSALALESRPLAEIELVENLGAVVGTHAGPGSVGFFWFQDD
ncbi:MAG: DegV family protein [Thermoleophilia bacterium]